MKKIILLISLSIFAFTSCNKEKNCECIVDKEGQTKTEKTIIDEGECSDLNQEKDTKLGKITFTCKED